MVYLRALLAWVTNRLTGTARHFPRAERSPSLVHRAFRAYERLFGRRDGIRAESSVAVFTGPDGRTIVEQRFFTWEAALMYAEHRLRAFLRNPLRLPKLEWVRVMQPAVPAGPGQPFALPAYRLAIAYDAATQGTSGLSTNTGVSGSITCAGSNRFLIVHGYNTSGANDVSNVTFNSSALTEYGSHPSEARMDTWFTYAPAATTANVTTTISASDKNHFVAASYSGAKQSGFPDAVASDVDASTTAGAISVTPTVNNCWILGVSQAQRVSSAVNGQPTAGSSTTRRAQAENYFSGTTAYWSTGIFDNNAAVNPAASTTLNFSSTVTCDFYNRAFALAPYNWPPTVKTRDGITPETGLKSYLAQAGDTVKTITGAN